MIEIWNTNDNPDDYIDGIIYSIFMDTDGNYWEEGYDFTKETSFSYPKTFGPSPSYDIPS